jgi:hypothetical protein
MKAFRQFIIAIGLLATALPASALQVTGGFTGWWDQPEQQNHGVIITISRLPGGEKTGVVYWAYYQDGTPTWVIAQGDLDGDTIDATVYRVEGIDFMQPYDPDGDFVDEVGTMQVQFDSCAAGTVDYDIESLGQGSFDISRLDTPPGRNCTGGLSDDRRPDLERERIEVVLQGEGEARGYAELDLRPGRAAFEVSVRGLMAGEAYVLQMTEDDDEIKRLGVFEVFESASGGTYGEIEFRSPQAGTAQELDFDPRGRLIEVLDAGAGVVLSGTLPEEGELPGRGVPPFDSDFKDPGFGGREIELQLDNVAAPPSATAQAELTMGGGQMEFEIEVYGLGEGEYPVQMNGSPLGTIIVDTNGTGEIEFGYPEDDGQQPLDFDPAGALIQIFDGTDPLLFEGVFPDFRGEHGGPGHGSGNGPGSGSGGGPGSGPGGSGSASSDEIRVQFDNIGASQYAGARAYAEYEIRTNRVSFEIELDAMPGAGFYDFLVDINGDGEFSNIGQIEVDDDAEGELEFGDPPRFDEQILTFDPRGKTLEIRSSTETVFRVDFPN